MLRLPARTWVAIVGLGFPLLLAAEVPPVQVWQPTPEFLIGGKAPEVLGHPRMKALEGVGSALCFDGIADGLTVPVNPIAGLKAFTVEVLLRPDRDGPEAQRFLHMQDAAEHRMLMELRMGKDSRWCLDTHLFETKETQHTLIRAEKLHEGGTWHWVALVYDGETMRHYVDGQPEDEAPIRIAPLGEGRTSIGVRMTKRSWYKGAIKEIRISPGVLPQEQLQRR